MTALPDSPVPSPETLRALIGTLLEQYADRDKLIALFRAALDGKTPISAPQSMQYKIVTSHGFHLRAAINEKTARYRRNPEIKVIAPKGSGKTGRSKSADLETALNFAQEAIDLNSDGNTWSLLSSDVHIVDAAVERIERAPAAFWPEITVLDDKGKNRLMHLFEDADAYGKAKDEYLRQAGIPIRSVYVPLERFYPVFEAATMVEAIEFEERSLRSVLRNKLFDTSALSGISTSADGGLKQSVVIVHWSDQNYHAYYALAPKSSRNSWPKAGSTRELSGGQPVLLHAYRHGLGRPIYNYITGRGTGWKGGSNTLDGVMHALLQLSSDQDNLRSQILTYIRNLLWPTRVMKYDRDARGQDDSVLNPPEIPEGSTIGMWVGESLENVTVPMQQFQLAEWMYKANQDRIYELAGSPALFGAGSTGVYTGYHQQLQITQAEHLDSLLEASLARGAVERMRIILAHIREAGEKCYVHANEKGAGGRLVGKYIAIDPKELTPMPQIAAKVRDPRPADFLTSVQAALQATQIRPGHNTPLLDDDFVRENFLGVEDGDEVDRRILEQTMRTKLMQGDVVTQTLGLRLGMALARAEGAPLTPEAMSGASPAFQQAAMQLATSGEAAKAGGIAPGNLLTMADHSSVPIPPGGPAPIAQTGGGGALTGLGGGVPPGNPQPSQVAGKIQQLLQAVR